MKAVWGKLMKEKLSALIDGEISRSELNEILDAAKTDSELRQLYGDYVRVQSSLHGESGPEIADKIWSKLGQEPEILAPRAARQRNTMRRLVSGMAIAATVAGVAIGGLRWFAPNQPSSPQLIASAPEQADYVRASGTRWKLHDPKLENDLNVYLVEHGGFAGPSSMNGIQSYVKVAGYDDEK